MSYELYPFTYYLCLSLVGPLSVFESMNVLHFEWKHTQIYRFSLREFIGCWFYFAF
jgi:hypothetical protein